MIPVEIPSCIAEGTRIQGHIVLSVKTHFMGALQGNLTQQSLEELIIGPSAWLLGSISSQGPVTVQGRVEGNIYSEALIRLLPTATVEGTLVSPRIEVLPGAILRGQVMMRWSTTLNGAQGRPSSTSPGTTPTDDKKAPKKQLKIR